MNVLGRRQMTTVSARSAPLPVHSNQTGRGRDVLIVLLALLYPWHLAIGDVRYTEEKTYPIAHGGLNLSLGDGIVALVGVILLFQLAAGRVRFPRYALPAFAWFTVAAVSVTLNALFPAFTYFELHDSVVGLIKIVAA